MTSSLTLAASNLRTARIAGLLLVVGMFVPGSAKPAAIAIPGMRVVSAIQKEYDRAPTYRIHGKVSAIDRAAKTFTIAGKSGSKTLAVVRVTVVIKDGATASFASVAVGDEADGIASIMYDKLTALSVRFGPFRDLPYGTPVPGQPGYVISPYSPRAGYVDVSGMAAGIEAKDPYSDKIFLLPRPYPDRR
jgi:hypothetical protein